jgi:hypothetical protein
MYPAVKDALGFKDGKAAGFTHAAPAAAAAPAAKAAVVVDGGHGGVKSDDTGRSAPPPTPEETPARTAEADAPRPSLERKQTRTSMWSPAQREELKSNLKTLFECFATDASMTGAAALGFARGCNLIGKRTSEADISLMFARVQIGKKQTINLDRFEVPVDPTPLPWPLLTAPPHRNTNRNSAA